MKIRNFVLVCVLAFCAACSKAPEAQKAAQKTAAPAAVSTVRAKSSPGARVFIVEPVDGATVASPVTVKFGVEGVELAKAGEVKDNSGHHHLLIDTETLPPMYQPLPFSDHLLHFGQAQTEASINLSPGPHTLQIILAGGNHIPLDPPLVSGRIKILVK